LQIFIEVDMGVPSEELMKLMETQQKKPKVEVEVKTDGEESEDEGEGEEEGMSGAETPPMSAPMSTPEPAMGSKEGAMVDISLAVDLIKRSLPGIGANSKEGKMVVAAMKALMSVVGKRKDSSEELKQSEILQMLQSLPQAGGQSPEGKAMATAPAVPGMM
jgi:hypothetical protein